MNLQKYTCIYDRNFFITQSPNYPHVHDHCIEVEGLTFIVELSQLDLTGHKQTRFDVFRVMPDGARTECLVTIIDQGNGEWVARQAHQGYIGCDVEELYKVEEDCFMNAFAHFVDMYDPH